MKRSFSLFAFFAAFLLPLNAYAGGSGMPWESAMDQILQSVRGSTATALVTGAIIFCGLGFAFSEGGGMLRRALWVVTGCCIALGGANVFLNLFGGASGAVM